MSTQKDLVHATHPHAGSLNNDSSDFVSEAICFIAKFFKGLLNSVVSSGPAQRHFREKMEIGESPVADDLRRNGARIELILDVPRAMCMDSPLHEVP